MLSGKKMTMLAEEMQEKLLPSFLPSYLEILKSPVPWYSGGPKEFS